MYEFLDRSVASLSAADRFLVSAMRAWVSEARSGRCHCSGLVYAFRYHRMEVALADFGTFMTALDSAAIGHLRFGSLDSVRLTDDEARILALFDVARAGPVDRLRRVSASLVNDDAVPRLVQAVDFVALAMADLDTGRSA